MTEFSFVKATKEQAKLRMALIGPPGGGKTFTALTVARELGGRVACIDTEHGSASKYADMFSFDRLNLTTYAPLTYVGAIQAAVDAGYDVLVIDSLSHAWSGKDGALEQVDQATARSRSHNKFTDGWREVTPMHNRLIDAIIGAPLHVIATMRTKTEYVIEENDRGQKVPRKVGLAPVQRSGMEYEFDVVGDMDADHKLIVSKSRCPQIADAVILKPGAEFAQTLAAWLGDGEPPPPPADTARLDAAVAALAAMGDERDFYGSLEAAASREHGLPLARLSQEQVDAYAARLEKLAADTRAAKESAGPAVAVPAETVEPPSPGSGSPADHSSAGETPQPGTDGSSSDGSTGESSGDAPAESLFKAPTGPRGSKRKET